MGLGNQLLDVFRAPAALARLSGRCWGLLFAYLVAAGALLGAVGAVLINNQDRLRALAVSYVLPESWRFAGELLIGYFLASQAKEVLANAMASGALVAVAVLLFPLKEKLSARFEQDAALTDEPIDEFPLWLQGLEELKLALLYVTAFMVIFWIGYHPDPTRKIAASATSYAFLFFSFAIDFISPLLQRHRLRYSQVVKTLLVHPVAALGFGALFAMPAVLVGLWLKAHPSTTFATTVLMLFAANVLAIAWAAVAGTWIASRLLEAAKQTRRSSWPARLATWALVLVAFSTSAYVFGSLGRAIHHKSQILKCEYSVDWKSIGLELPTLKKGGGGITGWLKRAASTAWDAVTQGGNIEVGAHMTVRIKNPTDFDVRLEKNRVEVKHGDTLVANTSIGELAIPAGAERAERVDFKVKLNTSALAKGRELLTNRWAITLYLELAPRFEFPVYLLAPQR
jgi:hypothetical protein